jgi:CheY-like chemotaxis protein
LVYRASDSDGYQCKYLISPSPEVAHSQMQMPIVDGIQSTRMIRTFESVETPTPGAHPTEPAAPPPLETTIAIDVLQTSKPTHTPTSVPPISPPPTNLGPEEGSEGTPNPGYFNLPLSPSSSDLASTQDSVAPPIISPIELPPAEQEQERPKSATFVPRRIPIFAVSAGLDQHSQESLEDAGFDGWMSKPIDFKKLAIVIEGVLDHDRRVMAKSRAGDYADGGWFR